MSEVTRILSQLEDGDPQASEKLLPLVYEELRKLAAAKMAQERPGQTLQATALVHEAYLRLVGQGAKGQGPVASPDKMVPGPGSLAPAAWDSRGHFFAAAAEAMRRILVDNARHKQADIHGSGRQRVMLEEGDWFSKASPEEIVDLDDSLAKLAAESPEAAEIIKLRVFAGLSLDEAAACLKVSRATAHRHWTYARAWLRAERAS